MAEFSVKTNAVRTTIDAEEGLRRELESIQEMVREISGSLAIKTAAAPDIKKRLGSLAGRVEGHRESMGSMKNALERAAGLYEETEKRVCGNTEGGIKAAGTQTAGSGEKSLAFFEGMLKMIGKMAGTLFPGLQTLWSDLVKYFEGIIGNGDVTDSQPAAAWGSGIGKAALDVNNAVREAIDKLSTGSGATTGGATKYKQPDYAQRDLAPNADGIYGPYVYWKNGGLGSVAYWNKPGQLSCTYYTLRKLNEQGLSYPCVGGPGNGRQWYANFDFESGLPNYGGNNALEDLANGLTLPQKNIVVSFDSDPSGNGWGHVLLIDEIYRDESGAVRVKYSDMFYTEPGQPTRYIDTLNGNLPTLDRTLEEFKASYSKSNGNINGAVVIGEGDRPRSQA